jgi:hypothetical protein
MDGLGVYWGAYCVGLAMLNEDSFNHEGITYQAIERETCIGCALEKYSFCHIFDDQPYCMSSMREDNKDIIWVMQD